jgi:predicted  nucleic acid-binding Zn-ribbon protein
MKNKAIKQLIEIQETYNKNGDVEQVKKSIKELPVEMQELFNEMTKHIENEKN